jgi:hypothetical protein
MSAIGSKYMQAIDPLNFFGDGGWGALMGGGKTPTPKITTPSTADPDSTPGTTSAPIFANAASQNVLSSNTARSRLLS